MTTDSSVQLVGQKTLHPECPARGGPRTAEKHPTGGAQFLMGYFFQGGDIRNQSASFKWVLLNRVPEEGTASNSCGTPWREK